MASKYGSVSDGDRKRSRNNNRKGHKSEKTPLLAHNYSRSDIDDHPGSSNGHSSSTFLSQRGRLSYRQLSTELKRSRPNLYPATSQALTIMTHYDDDYDDADFLKTTESPADGTINRASAGDGDKLPPFTKRQLLTVIILSFANFCSTVVFSCIAPFYPNEAQSKGLTQMEIGIIFGVLELVMFITAPFLGKYLHVIGSKFMFTTGLFITGSTSILFGFLNLTNSGPSFFWLSLIVRCFEAVGDAAFLTASFAICAFSFPGRIASIVGILETFVGLGFTAGPAIGGVLYQLGGYQLPFTILGALLLLASLLSYFLLDSSVEDQCVKGSRGMLSLLRMPMIVLMMTAIIACSMTLSFTDPTLAAHLDGFNLSPMLVGLMFLWGAGVYTLTAPFWGFLIDRVKQIPPYLMMVGALLSFVSMIFIGPSPLIGFDKSLYSIAASLVVMGLGVGAVYIPTFQTCLETAKENGYPDNYETYGLVSGLFQAVYSLGGFIGPTIGGVVVQAIGFPWTTTIIAGLHLLVALALLVYISILAVGRRRGNAQSIVPAKEFVPNDKWMDGGTFSL